MCHPAFEARGGEDVFVPGNDPVLRLQVVDDRGSLVDALSRTVLQGFPERAVAEGQVVEVREGFVETVGGVGVEGAP